MKRGFVAFIMDPIIKLTNAMMDGHLDVAYKMFDSIGLKLSEEEKSLTGKQLLKAAMSKWINAADTLLDMMVVHLPSPRTAQRYRTSYLYDGP